MVGLGWGWVTALGNPGNGQVLERSSDGRRLVVGKALGAARAREPSAAAPERGERPRAAARGGHRVAPVVAGQAGHGRMRAMGLTLLAVVFLGPTVQPWYVAWSVVVLATIAEHRLRVLVIVLSMRVLFLRPPGSRKARRPVRRGQSDPHRPRLDRHAPPPRHPARDEGPKGAEHDSRTTAVHGGTAGLRRPVVKEGAAGGRRPPSGRTCGRSRARRRRGRSRRLDGVPPRPAG